MKVSVLDVVIDMGMEGQRAVEDDAQTLNLRGGGGGGVVDCKREAVHLE